jgi:ubiquinone/menaquinone biosynthesis C-methylase UbiE
MGLYERYVLPRLVHHTCSLRSAMKQRPKTVPRAAGEVLEVGFGSGLNLPYYDSEKVRRVWALDPSVELWRMAREEVESAGFPVEFLEAPAEAIPLEEHSVDTVVVTYTLCTIADLSGALGQIRRVLRPGGRLVFCEHGEAPDPDVRRWQRWLNPIWRRLGGGCYLDRPIPHLLEAGGFRIRDLTAMYIPGWRPACYNYWGTAVSS